MPVKLAALLQDKPNKSAFIAEAVAEKLSQEQKQKSEAELAEAYRLDSAHDASLLSDWDSVSGDGI